MLSLASLALSLACPNFGTGPDLPTDFQLVDVVTGLDLPVAAKFSADGRMFIAEKGGTVRTWLRGALQPEPVIDLTALVNNSADRGLLALALHPDYQPDAGDASWLYLFYVASPIEGEDPQYNENDYYSWSILERYRTNLDGFGVLSADLTSRQILLGERQADGSAPDTVATLHSSHAVGTLVFGTDGSLLLSAGDGAHYDAIDSGGIDIPGFDNWKHPETGLYGPTPADQDCGAFRAQDLRSLAGKILRLDPETGNGLPSNPFFDGDPSSNASRIYTLGLRNPYRLALQPGSGSSDPQLADPGRLLVGDVGWINYEEIDVVDGAGWNYGWPCFEGPFPQPDYDDSITQPESAAGPDCVDCSQVLPGNLRLPAVAWTRFDPIQALPAGIYTDIDGAPLDGITGSCVVGGSFYAGGNYPNSYVDRWFIADFAAQWIRTLELDASGAPTEVQDFAFDVPGVVDLERDPSTGDIHLVVLGGPEGGTIQRLVFGSAAPIAKLVASPNAGLAPLDVSLDASGSSDPENEPLQYEFRFGDGTPPFVTSESSVDHVYTQSGQFLARVEVRDPSNEVGFAEVQILVGSEPPELSILSPEMGAEVPAPGTLIALGSGFDTQGQPVPLEWTLDFYQNDSIHPQFGAATGSQLEFELDAHPDNQDLFYYRIELGGTAPGGATAEEHIFVYPEGQTLDLSGVAQPMSSLEQLGISMPTGPANHDIEVLRDSVIPTALEGTLEQTFTTEHPAADPANAALGLRLVAPLGPFDRLVELEYTLGAIDPSGGWFESFGVEALQAGGWSAVENLVIEPPYPPIAAQPPAAFSTYRLRFDPVHAVSIRLRGRAGGSTGFVGASELRMTALTQDALATNQLDYTSNATPIARVMEEAPLAGGVLSGSLANADPMTFINGTFGVSGSSSLWASFDSSLLAPLSGDDWFGLDFDVPHTIERVTFQEGTRHSGGGGFSDLRLEYRALPGGPWSPVPNASFAPPFTPSLAPADSYRTFEITFPPIALTGLRMSGAALGPTGFASAAELRASGAWYDVDVCGVLPYFGAAQFPLHLSSATPPIPGAPAALLVDQAPGAAPGIVAYALQSAELPLFGSTLLVDPLTTLTLAFDFDANGEAWLPFIWPADIPVGTNLYIQAGYVAPPEILLSNGVRYFACP